MKINSKDIAKSLLEKYIDCYERKDLNEIRHLFGNKTSFWGTAKDEKGQGVDYIIKQIKRDWSEIDKIKFELKNEFFTDDYTNWIAAELDIIVEIKGTTQVFHDLRVTLNTKQSSDNTYKISHLHFSFPDFRNNPGKSFPNI